MTSKEETYRCPKGHETRRLTSCWGWKDVVLNIHIDPPCHPECVVLNNHIRTCDCGIGPALRIDCPATVRGSAPDALTIPPPCGLPADLVVRETKWFCDDPQFVED